MSEYSGTQGIMELSPYDPVASEYYGLDGSCSCSSSGTGAFSPRFKNDDYVNLGVYLVSH